ncbi:FRA10AC1 [Symbiodinium microadriaticum]|nr:FRA10AC1 [Symbiodinium microadriaticum]
MIATWVDCGSEASKGHDGMKGKGKGKNPHRGKGHTLPRVPSSERISETPMIGEVLEWKGKYGWLKPQEPIQHEKASRHRGKIFASVADLVGVTELTVGRLVQFRLFSDQSGLGAEEIQQT